MDGKKLLLGLAGGLLSLFFLIKTWSFYQNYLDSKKMKGNLTPTSLKNLIKSTLGVSDAFAWILTYQSAHETGYWKSPVFKENKNLFGMRRSKVRKNLQNGERNGHATYLSYVDSIKDMGLWLKSVGLLYGQTGFTGTDVDIRLYALSIKEKGYYTDTLSNYSNGMIAAKSLLNS